ncbi:uncharacterized protein DUF4237 [Microbacterium sp. SLBN-154]|uniref:TNT domain-containing protein n=1 Tax=Microbacterium sp. SLBN-154 TaxID=2768458 RepID=UPI00115331AC|nr:TNT domain-containing protein [Microbacterium sp. SLBN-154]TQK18372.1 uncharacterized protein DUF4237 [Microbacterium sp. SLBN-154]
MPSAIDPDAIPGKDIDPDTIELHAGTVNTVSGQVRDHGAAVHTKWQGMAAVYEAPESGIVLDLMQPVNTQSTQVGDNLSVVSQALTGFAEAVRPIKAALDQLRLDAQAFRAEIAGGVQVQELNPAYTAYGSYGTTAASYSGSWNAYGAAGSTSSAEPVEQYRTVTKEWHEVQEYVDRNNDLIAQVNAQQVLLWEAERDCANKIRALYGADPLRAAQSEDDALGYGIEEIPEGTEMPWGAEVERTEGCGEATAKFVFKDFLWEGIAVGGIWGTVEGLGTLVLGYNPATGDFFSGDAYGAAWGNLGNLLFAGMANGGVLAPIFHADTLMQQFGGDGFLPQEVRDFKAQADEAAINTGKALIAWDKWADDPGTALGESVFNVGTALIPVGGAAVAGVKTASTAASVLSRMARVADFVDPAAWAVNGTMRLGSAGLGSLDNLIGRLDNAPVDVNLGPVEVYTATDSASAMRLLDEAGVDPQNVFARVDETGTPVLEFPGGVIEMPAGSFDNAAGGGVRGGDGGADGSVSAPVREPELVNAGGVRGETGPAPVNAIVDEAPVRTETGGSGGSGGDANTPSGGGAGSGDGSGPGDGSPPVDRGGEGDGWTQGPEHRGGDIDPQYGEPRADHGTLADQYAPPAEVPADIRHLVSDPEAPYGRGSDGEPYTRAEWEERYMGPDNRPIYPGNDGAVPGSRVSYTDMEAFHRDYGDTIDRFGGSGGAYLSPEGVLFEQRALPGGNLNAGYHVFRLTDELPPGVHIEVSEVAPAFGQPGGGIQLQFVDDVDGVLSVEQLLSNDYRIIESTTPTVPDGVDAGAGLREGDSDAAAAADPASEIAFMAESDSTVFREPETATDGGGGDGEGSQTSVAVPDPEYRPFPTGSAQPAVIDYTLADQNILGRLDPATGPDNATFWSGRVLDEDGVVIPDAAMNGAADLTTRTHGSTLEQLLEKQGLLDDMPDDWFDPATGATWRAVSEALARNASGDVRAYLGDVREGSVWNEVEFPTLIQNPDVTSVTVIDARTGEVLYVYRR